MQVSKQHSTAILVFANSSIEEMQHKKIACGEQLFDSLTQQTLKTVKKTKIPFFHLTEVEQKGDSFGERFTNAIQYVFDQGFENVITVGNDSPHLTKAHILHAISHLEQSRSVIGPSADGGFYLMGLHRSDFEKSDFELLSWQTSRIRKEVLDLLSLSSEKIHLLHTLFDIDTFFDVKLIAKYASGLSQNILRLIRSMTSLSNKLEIPKFSLVSSVHSQIHFNKGSPIRSFS
ncbi:TIGR04282 family arsenosugar biosynthesis glycosyltransferase [Maribacter halichondriae]|uniref:TIGR04282 family arsenosugar biosynthesis glycosyltransferase n=1 Tax=Maribacter halichondriae TaxID=2980554 RepID=UPI00235885FA|nr:DUF2064 domain-containing protein [Maribacter sp. Hal144]